MKNKNYVIIFMIIMLYSMLSVYAQPVPVWVNTYNGSNNGNDRAHKTITDISGNIYVLGTTYNAQTKEDVFLSKYSNSGSLLWQRFYAGDTDADDTPVDIGADAQNNIYIAVNNTSPSNHKRAVIRKYSTAGTLLWTVIFAAPHSFITNAQKTAGCLKVIPDGTVFIGGRWFTTQGPTTLYGLLAYKITSGGLVSDSSISITGMDTNSTKNYNDITVDNSGNVFYAGTLGNNMYVKKFDVNFDSVWARSYNGSGNGMDEAEMIYVDNNFYTYTAGYVKTGANGKDFAVVKYDNSGTQVWVKTYDGPAHGDDVPSDMAVSNDGSVYITGTASGGSSGNDIATCRITSAGNLVWSQLYNGSAGGNDFSSSILLDNAGALYVGGTSDEGVNGTDYIVLKYSTLFSNMHWSANYSLSSSDTLTGMIMDNNYNLYVCGHQKRFLNNDRDMGLYKLGSTIGITPVSNNIPEKFELSQNYPNPFNPVTNIKFSIPKAGNVKLAVFDAAGRQLAELVNQQLNAGTYNYDYNASGLASGVYFYKLVSADFSEVKKMILVK